MPNIAAILKAEIARIARREIKLALAQLQKSTSKSRKASIETKTKLAELERRVKALAAESASRALGASEEPASAELRMTGKRVKSLRGRLGVTQAQFGLLVGVTSQAVAVWERHAGLLKLRSKARVGLSTVRGLTAREARARVEELSTARRTRATSKAKPRGRRRGQR